VGLVARHLEANGIATVILGSARDVVELCGVPRFLFSDFPLGNPCGRPYDEAMQRAIVGMGLDLLESAVAPRTTQPTPFVWSEDESWKGAYARVSPEDTERVRQAGEARRARQARAKRGSL
jgi:D-proline reductase (dithiol) PrdB